MTPLLACALEFQKTCDALGWPFCIIGGLAVVRWGQPRFTRDVDISLFTGFGDERAFAETLLARGYRGRLQDAADFSVKNRVLLLEDARGVPLDVAFAAFPFELEAIARASEFEFEPECRLRTCSAEDLLIQKLFAARPRDVADAEGIAARQKGHIDWSYAEQRLQPLAQIKAQPEILAHLARLKAL